MKTNEAKTYSKHINDLTPKERRRIETQNEELARRLKKKGRPNPKVEYKRVPKEEQQTWTDRPKKLKPQLPVVDTKAFRREVVLLCVKYLKKVKRHDLPLALCQLQDNSTVFGDDTESALEEHGIRIKRRKNEQ